MSRWNPVPPVALAPARTVVVPGRGEVFLRDTGGADIAEAGRELGRFDARPWLGEIRAPAAVVVTADDTAVPPRLQRDLAKRLGAPVFASPGDHLTAPPSAAFTRVLLAALRAVGQEVSSPPSTGRTIPVT